MAPLCATTLLDRNVLRGAALLLREMGAREVYVFGSAAKNELRPNSDIDLAVTGLPPRSFFYAVAKASDYVGRPVDLVDLDVPSPIVGHLLRSGELELVD